MRPLAAAWLLATSVTAMTAASARGDETVAPLATAQPARMQEPITLGILDFAYIDTSGEQADQTEQHHARLEAFMAALRKDLARADRFRVVIPLCGSDPCSVESTEPADLEEAAQHAGARYILVGGIHKMSTLVQWVQFTLIDVSRDKVVLQRLLTFRGDDDGSWQHAEAFLAKLLAGQNFEP